MKYIKEPEDIDLIIQSPPLTEKEKLEITEFIKNYKAKPNKKLLKTKKKVLV